jgi:hypothetical protein
MPMRVMPPFDIVVERRSEHCLCEGPARRSAPNWLVQRRKRPFQNLRASPLLFAANLFRRPDGAVFAHCERLLASDILYRMQLEREHVHRCRADADRRLRHCLDQHTCHGRDWMRDDEG